MPAELLALGAASMHAASQVVTKVATSRGGSVLPGFVISLGAGTILLGGLAVATVDTWRVTAPVATLFVLAGLVGAGLGRLLMMRAVRDAGASVASPVQSSTQPMMATVAAAVVLREQVSLGRVLALGLVVIGLWLAARGGSANRHDGAVPLGPSDPVGSGNRWVPTLRMLAWPVAAGTALAMADLLRKAGLDAHPDAVLGGFLGVVAAFGGWVVVLAVRARRHRPWWPATHRWYALHGVMIGSATTLLLLALRSGDLSVVAPVAASQPIFVIGLSALLLRDVEALRPGTVFGAIAVFGGVAAMSVLDGAG
nr:DMT family transporter [Micromonospora sp. DSM 115978]